MVVLGSFDDGGGVGSLGRAQESLCVAGAGRGAQGELDAARGFGVVVAVDISGFQLSGQVAPGQDAPGSGRERDSLSRKGCGGHRWRWAEGAFLGKERPVPAPTLRSGRGLLWRGRAGLCSS